jgi:TPR repeat protein
MVVVLLVMAGAGCGPTGDSSTRSQVPTANEQPAATLRRAEAGNPFEQAMLGAMYFRGDHVPQDYVRSYMWFNIAAARASEGQRISIERLRAEVAEKLTPAQIAEAQKRASEWMDAFEKRRRP